MKGEGFFLKEICIYRVSVSKKSDIYGSSLFLLGRGPKLNEQIGLFLLTERGGWFGGSSHGKNFGGFFTLNKTGFLLSHPHIPSLSFLKKKYITLKFQNAQPIIILYTFSFYFSFCFFFLRYKEWNQRREELIFSIFFLLLSQEPKPVCSKKFFYDIRCLLWSERKAQNHV